MTDCQRCGAKAHNAFICRKCEQTVRQVLTDLPWWLARLTEAATGQTRMSDNGGRKSAPRKGLDGETPLAQCIEPLPDEDDLEKARRKRAKAALAHALAAGGIDPRASELLGEITDSLGYWIRVLCEQRGVEIPLLRAGRTPGALRAKWLALHVSAIAASEDADEICCDIESHMDDIVATINRPIPIRHLGKCPTWNEDKRRICGVELRAPEEELEVYCRRCKITHSVHRLLLARQEEAERTPITWDKLVKVNRMQPDGYQVPLRTLQHWRTREYLRPRGWLRPDGQRGIARHGDQDQPLFLWSDVRNLRVGRRQRETTGAAAHRRNTPC